MREGAPGGNVPLSVSGIALATSPQRGEEPRLEKRRRCGSGSSPLWGEVAREARRRGVHLIREVTE